MKKVLLMYKGRLTDREFVKTYGNFIKDLGNKVSIELMPVYHPDNVKKVARQVQKDWLASVEPALKDYDYLLVSEPEYFKVISKQSKAESNLGLIFPTDYSNKVLYIPSYQAVYFNKEKANIQISQCITSLKNDIEDNYSEIGSDIIHFEDYPLSVSSIKEWLEKLKQYPALTCDIEAKSLKVTEAGIYTIGFAWNKHNGICFPVDAIPTQSKEVRQLLKEFFDVYEGRLIVHKANYDIPVINYTLFQNENITDIKAQMYGLSKLCNNLDDTLLITYLATNSCGGNTLGLKELAQPFAGKWAVDVSDVTKVDLHSLMRYNLIDCLSTWYVYETYYPKMVNDSQESIYKNHFLPYLKDNIRCQLNGLPLDLIEVKRLQKELLQEQETLTKTLRSSKLVTSAEYIIAEKATIKRNAKLKKKQTTVEENLQPFNFGSSKHLTVLIYDVMGLPCIDFTDSKQPSTSKNTLSKLINITVNQKYKDLLNALIELSDVDKMLTTFIPAFSEAHIDKYGNAHLLGYFNLAGTVSGRLSSSNPNLQNIPATGSRFAKPIKKCFKSTDDWIFCGIDFNALEARIAAVTTKDPARKSVYIEGYDSHCMNAFAMLSSLIPDIVEKHENALSKSERVTIINSIADKHKNVRQKAKPCGFLLQYGGTDHGLVVNLGFTPKEAKEIYDGYCTLYKVTIEWTANHIEKAKQLGYVEVAFGLRVRTPLLKNSPKSSMASAEARTAGNALGQSWGLLNDRAMNEVLQNVDSLGLTEHILPVAKVHDCGYYLVRNDINIINTLNALCVKAAKWQEDPVIADDDVHLSGNLDLFYPSWATPITLPEQCNEQVLIETVRSHLEEKTNA